VALTATREDNMQPEKPTTRSLSVKARAQALISWLEGWHAAERHYFKGKKPPGTMSGAIEAKILSELQGKSGGKSKPSKTRKASAANPGTPR
jgi:hypothetical protein